MKLSPNVLKALIAVALLLGALVVVMLSLPGIVTDRVLSEVKARTGLPARLGSASVGLTSISVHDLAIGGKDGGPSIKVGGIDVRTSPLSILFGGASAIDDLAVSDLDVVLPLADRSTRDLLRRVGRRRAASGDSGAGKGEGVERRVQLDRFSIEVSDEHGPLIDVRGQRAQLTGDLASADLQEIVLGSDEGTRVRMSDLEAAVERGATGSRLKRLKVARSHVHLASVPAAVEPSADAGDDGEAQDATARERTDDEPAQDSGESDEVALTAEPAAPRLLGRLRALAGALDEPGKARAADSDDATGSDGSDSAGSVPAWRRLADDVVIILESATVEGPAEDEPVLQELSAKLEGRGEAVFGLSGLGKARGGGSLRCEMTLRPEKLEADGTLELRALPLTLVAPLLPAVPWHAPHKARIDASLVIKTESVQRVALSGEATLRHAAIAAPRIANVPVRDINLTLSGQGHWLPLEKRLELEEAELSVGASKIVVKGAVEWTPEHYLADLDARLVDTPCTAAVQSIPEDLLGEMALATWSGKIGAQVRLKLDSRVLDETVLEFEIRDRCEFVAVPAMADLRRFRMPFEHSVVEPNGEEFRMETGPGTPAWTYLEDISPFLVHAVLAHEDTGFFSHQGFSPFHIRNALVRNLREGRYVVGASTITMQLVKNIFLHREKTLARKIQEVLLTWWIERVMDKSEILELYLNVIEYGPSVYGIRDGARHYFNRLPAQLSPAESVYLSNILPNPKAYHSHFERGALPPHWVERLRKMLERMKARDWYSPEAADYGVRELESFRFYPPGTITEPREIPGSTAPLPYMRGYGVQGEWDRIEGAGALGLDFLQPAPG